jgi:hypothetical protein
LFSVCDVLSLVHPTAAIVATIRVAVIFPLRVMWPPLCGRPLHRGRSFDSHKRKRVANRMQAGRRALNAMDRNELRVQLEIDDASEGRAGRVRPDT